MRHEALLSAARLLVCCCQMLVPQVTLSWCTCDACSGWLQVMSAGEMSTVQLMPNMSTGKTQWVQWHLDHAASLPRLVQVPPCTIEAERDARMAANALLLRWLDTVCPCSSSMLLRLWQISCMPLHVSMTHCWGGNTNLAGLEHT